MPEINSDLLSLETGSYAGRRGTLRKGSIFTLFNFSSNERLNETMDVDIQLFDGGRMRALIDFKVTGKTLVRYIASELGDASKAKYLGLIIEPDNEFPEWMDLNNSVAKEKASKRFDVIMVRIKFYPADPITEMVPEQFANLLYYQLRHDLAFRRLLGKEKDRCNLIAYSIQYEGWLNNVSLDEVRSCQIKSKHCPQSIDSSMQNQIRECLCENYGLSPQEVLKKFFKTAIKMDTYGVEPFDAKDQRGNGIAIGFNFKGLSVFKSSQQVNFFRWESMLNYECERKNVIITIKTRETKKKIGFKFDTRNNAMQLFRRLREASRFYYTIPEESQSDSEKPPKIGTPIFSRSIDSDASDTCSISGSNQICRITRLPNPTAHMRPHHLFTLVSPKTSNKLVPPPTPYTPDEAPTPTNNGPITLANPPPNIPHILLCPPDREEGPATPTPSLINHQDGTSTPLSCETHEDVQPHQEGGVKVEEKKEEEKGSNQSSPGSMEIESLVIPGLGYPSSAVSQESVHDKPIAPFGDASKIEVFKNKDNSTNRLSQGVLNLTMSESMTSIMYPRHDDERSASLAPHYFPRWRGTTS